MVVDPLGDRVEKSNLGLYRRQSAKLQELGELTGYPMAAIARSLVDIGLSHIERCSPPAACVTAMPCMVHLKDSPIVMSSMLPEAQRLNHNMTETEKHGPGFRVALCATFDILERGELVGIGGILREGGNWSFQLQRDEPLFGSERSVRNWIEANGCTIQWTWLCMHSNYVPEGYDGPTAS